METLEHKPPSDPRFGKGTGNESQGNGQAEWVSSIVSTDWQLPREATASAAGRGVRGGARKNLQKVRADVGEGVLVRGRLGAGSGLSM